MMGCNDKQAKLEKKIQEKDTRERCTLSNELTANKSGHFGVS